MLFSELVVLRDVVEPVEIPALAGLGPDELVFHAATVDDAEFARVKDAMLGRSSGSSPGQYL